MSTTPEAATDKKNSGCLPLLLKLAGFIAALFLFEYILSLIFHSVFKPDDLTNTFIPFQNHFLGGTDAFITGESMSSEFSNDVTGTGRFLANCILVLPVLAIVTVIAYQIPIIKKAFDYWMYAFCAPVLIVTWVYCVFFPTIKTVFDRKGKTMTVIRYEYMFLPSKEVFPFSSISGFDEKVEAIHGYAHDEDALYAEIHAIVGDRHIFIGENQVGSTSNNKDLRMPADRSKEVQDILAALKSITDSK